MHRPAHRQFLEEKNTNAPTSALAVPTGEKHQCTDQCIGSSYRRNTPMHRPVHWQFLQEKNTNAPTSALAVPTGEKHQCTDQRMFLQEKKDQFGSPTGQVSSTSCWTRPGKSIREAEKSLLVDAFEKVDDLVVPVKQIHGCLPFF